MICVKILIEIFLGSILQNIHYFHTFKN